MRVALATAITAWTLAAWGGRIGLLAGGSTPGDRARIGGSILVGLLAAATLVVPQLQGLRRPALILFSLFTLGLWARALLVNWTGPGSLGFKVVHTVLALGFFVLAAWSAIVALSGETAG